MDKLLADLDVEQKNKLYKSIGLLEEKLLYDQIQELKKWLNKYQLHLPRDISDNVLEFFIVGCKNNMDIAKRKIEYYYSCRHQLPEFYYDRDPINDSIKQSVATVACGPLPKLTPEGYAVNIIKLLNPEASLFDPATMIKRILMLTDLRILNFSSTAGELLIHDCQWLTVQHLAKFSPSLVKKYINVGQATLPMRIKAIILINVPSYMETVINICKMIMKDKLKKRLFVYSKSYTDLYEHVPKDILPKEYGGSGDVTISVINEKWQKELENLRKLFINKSRMASDESKRTNNLSNSHNELFAAEGTFRFINFD